MKLSGLWSCNTTVVIFALLCGLNIQAAQPVLIELFTSEGCSSCPPADELLQRLERSPAIPGVTVIAMSEHVDYWNHLGWRDPFSSAQFSARQETYASRFRGQGAYTPQMVVDGDDQFVGSDSHRAIRSIALAAARPKLDVKAEISDGLHITVPPEPAAADIFVAIVYDPDPSQVARGENSGRRLTHISVVKSLQRVGGTGHGKAFDARVPVSVDPKLANQRAVVFVQERGQGRILGLAEVSVRQDDRMVARWSSKD
jgi:hypothetical protein